MRLVFIPDDVAFLFIITHFSMGLLMKKNIVSVFAVAVGLAACQPVQPYTSYQNPTNPYGQPNPGPFQQPNQNPYGQQGQDPYGQQGQDPYGQQGQDPYGQQGQDPYGQQGQDPYGQQGQDPYGQQGQDPYGQQGQDPYGQQGQDPYGQQGQDPYGQQGQDPYGQQGQDPYAQPQPMESKVVNTKVRPNENLDLDALYGGQTAGVGRADFQVNGATAGGLQQMYLMPRNGAKATVVNNKSECSSAYKGSWTIDVPYNRATIVCFTSVGGLDGVMTVRASGKSVVKMSGPIKIARDPATGKIVKKKQKRDPATGKILEVADIRIEFTP